MNLKIACSRLTVWDINLSSCRRGPLFLSSVVFEITLSRHWEVFTQTHKLLLRPRICGNWWCMKLESGNTNCRIKSAEKKSNRMYHVWLAVPVNLCTGKHGAASKSARLDCTFSPHSGSIPRELVHSYALGCLWVVTVCCNTVGRYG